jgi:hypothetical protein
MSGLHNKKYLDETGLTTLWGRITNGFSPRWMAYRPTTIAADASTVAITHSSAATAEQKTNGQGPDIVVTLPTVTTEKAGVMSAADKVKLDNMGATAEGAVTIKQIQVKSQNLKIDTTNKYVNWDFVYNTTTDSLDIIDCNDSNKVLTTVSVNDFIGDAIKEAILTSADIVNSKTDANGETVTGTFIKLVFATKDQESATASTQEVYINVADLIDIYNAGKGIDIEQGAVNHDETQRTSTITLKIASTGEQGGFVAGWVDKTQEAVTRTDIDTRTFAVGIGKGDVAMVTVPIGTISTSTSTFTDTAVTINPAVGGSANVVTGITITEKTDNTGHNVVLTGNVVNVSKETSVTTTGTAGEDSKTIAFGDSFTVFKDITTGGTNGHTLTKSNTTWTLPELSKGNITSDTDAAVQTVVADNSDSKFVFEALTDISVGATTGIITPIKTKFTAQVDVTSIPIATIEGLAYPTDDPTA